jgi:hypothetical protein
MNSFKLSKGLALVIGINSVDPKDYGGWSGDLAGCEADAQSMKEIARDQGFKVTMLLTKEATREAVTHKIKAASSSLRAGDIFLLCYSGHGGQLPDRNDDEPDSIDETWCLYNSQLVDDELYSILGKFERRVRILVTSDSCHSGSVTRIASNRKLVDARKTNVGEGERRYRFMPHDEIFRAYQAKKGFYDKILRNRNLAESENSVKASVILISGCQDNQYSLDGTFNGLFTSKLLAVWKDGNFDGSYKSFHNAIVNRMPSTQTPNYYLTGALDAKFQMQKPFTI